MADTPHPSPGPNPGYETRDADIGAIVRYGVILTLIVVFSFVFVRWLFHHDVAAIDNERPEAPLLMETNALPPEPRLRVDALKDMARLRAYEDVLLNAYNWIDRDRGSVRIPVSRALALAAEHGLPSWPGLAPVVADTNAPAATADTNAAAAAHAPAAQGAAP